MNVKYEGFVDIPIKEWRKHSEKGDLVSLVERAGYQVIGEAMSKGFTNPVKDIKLEIMPNFDDERRFETVKVVLEYGSVL